MEINVQFQGSQHKKSDFRTEKSILGANEQLA